MSDQIVGYRYKFGLHMGIGRGPVNEVCEVRVGDRTAWTGSITDTTLNVPVNAYDLFGGDDHEGGVQGTMDILMGRPDQVAPAGLSAMLGGLVPGFRRVLTVFFDGMVCAISPYPKPWKFRVRRTTAGWDGDAFAPELATITLDGSGSGTAIGTPSGSYRACRLYAENFAALMHPSLIWVPGATWTVEGRFKFASWQGGMIHSSDGRIRHYNYQPLFSSLSWWIVVYDSANVCFRVLSPGFGMMGAVSAPSPITLDTEFVLAVEVTGSAVKIWRDGVLLTTVTDMPFVDASMSISLPANPGITIGAVAGSANYFFAFDGCVRDIRVTSAARYSGNYTPVHPLPQGTDDPLWSAVELLLPCDDLIGSSVPHDDSNHARTTVKQGRVEFTGTNGLNGSTEFPDSSPVIKAANPAHVIYETLTNREWGRGLPRAAIDSVSFTAAAQTLYNEGFGFCFRWSRQDTIESFIQMVLDHISASLYSDRTTGLLTLKLIRADYVVADVPLFDADSGLLEITEATYGSPAGLVNEVVVGYHDPVSDTDRKVKIGNLANLRTSNRAINSVSFERPGIPTSGLALRVAQRELRATSVSLRRFAITLDRRGWNVHPGQVIRIRDITRNIPDTVVRVGRFEGGTLQDGKIKIVCAQDVFAMPATSFGGSQGANWTPPTSTPCIGRHEVVEMPYAVLARIMSPADFAALTPESARFGVVCEVGQALNNSFAVAVRDGAATSDDAPVDSTYCGYIP